MAMASHNLCRNLLTANNAFLQRRPCIVQVQTEPTTANGYLISVGVALERPHSTDADVIGLLFCECGELGAERREVQTGNLLVKSLREEVNVVLIALLLGFQQVELRQHLVCERARHDERGMACRTAQIEEASSCEHDNTMSIREDPAVHLCLDVLHFDTFHRLQASHVDLIVKVPDVANDGIVLHLLHVRQCNDVEITRRRSENVDLAHNALHCDHLEAFHASLERTDRVDLGDHHASTAAPMYSAL